MVIGITGPSGAGKGTVSKMLNARGFHHIDTDLLAREVVPETLPRLVETFGEILNEDGTLDRKALAKKAFSSAENTEKLNKIMHGAIMDRTREIISVGKENGQDKFIIDGAALFEANATEICDYTIAVLSDRQTRLSRVMIRDGITEQQAEERFSRQLSDEFFRENTDFTVENTDLAETEKQLSEILNIIYGGKK